MTDELRELSEKATPGPVEAEPGIGGGTWIKGSDGKWLALGCGDDDETGKANAAFIVAAVNFTRHHLATRPDEVGELRKAVEIASVVFREYERLHLAKGTRDGDQKALRNRQYAEEMEAALKQGSDHGR